MPPAPRYDWGEGNILVTESTPTTVQKLAAEFFGTFVLVFSVIGAALFAAGFAAGEGGLNVGFLGVAIDNSDTYNTYFNMGTTDALQSHLKDQGETYRIIGIAGLALGVGAAVGAVWMFTHPRERQAPVTARLHFGIGPSGMALGGTF